MSSTVLSSQPPQNESKSAKKKKAKAEVPVKAPATVSTTDTETGTGQAVPEAAANGVDGVYESPYLKELYKYVRRFDRREQKT